MNSTGLSVGTADSLVDEFSNCRICRDSRAIKRMQSAPRRRRAHHAEKRSDGRPRPPAARVAPRTFASRTALNLAGPLSRLAFFRLRCRHGSNAPPTRRTLHPNFGDACSGSESGNAWRMRKPCRPQCEAGNRAERFIASTSVPAFWLRRIATGVLCRVTDVAANHFLVDAQQRERAQADFPA